MVLPKCIITPTNPSILSADGGIVNGTSNVMINCNCIDADYQEIMWHSPTIPLNNAVSEDSPYVIQGSGSLIFPLFNDSHQGIYYCGVRKDSMFAANISLTLWTGM